MDQYTTNETFKKLQENAAKRLKKFDVTSYKAEQKMLKNYNLTPESDLSIQGPINPEDINLTPKFRNLKTALIFPNEFVYSLVDSEKIPFGQLHQVYKKSGSSGKNIRKQRAVIQTNTYYVSFIDSKPYITVICDEYFYKYKDYLDLDKNYMELLEKEPFDITVSAILLINGQLPFSYYRLDNNAEFYSPHPNKMENGKVLNYDKIITGPHEHMYDETYSIIYPNFPYSYDAKEIYSSRKDFPKKQRPPLLRSEIDFLVKNKLNLVDFDDFQSEITTENENLNVINYEKLNSLIEEKTK